MLRSHALAVLLEFADLRNRAAIVAAPSATQHLNNDSGPIVA
jgi:hypothetical protein